MEDEERSHGGLVIVPRQTSRCYVKVGEHYVADLVDGFGWLISVVITNRRLEGWLVPSCEVTRAKEVVETFHESSIPSHKLNQMRRIMRNEERILPRRGFIKTILVVRCQRTWPAGVVLRRTIDRVELDKCTVWETFLHETFEAVASDVWIPYVSVEKRAVGVCFDIGFVAE